MNAVHYLARCTSRQAVLALAVCAFDAPVWAGVLEGTITFPGRTIPGSTVYAREVESGALHEVALKRSERDFRLELPAGHYWLFVRPDEQGLAELYGGHTRASACRTQPDAGENACQDHVLQPVEVPESGTVSGIAIDDWFLDEAQAQELDRILGEAGNEAPTSVELGWPRFSEYRAEAWESPGPARIDPADERVAPWLPQLEAAAAAGPNFAGRFTLVQLECGVDCLDVAILDVASGAVTWPDRLTRRTVALPCHSDRELAFRDDSRLLEHTHRDGADAITDYLLWDAEQRSFNALAQYRRSLERFCGATPQ